MMFKAKIAMRSTAPPANTLNMPRMPDDCVLNASANAAASMPGIGMKVPKR